MNNLNFFFSEWIVYLNLCDLLWGIQINVIISSWNLNTCWVKQQLWIVRDNEYFKIVALSFFQANWIWNRFLWIEFSRVRISKLGRWIYFIYFCKCWRICWFTRQLKVSYRLEAWCWCEVVNSITRCSKISWHNIEHFLSNNIIIFVILIYFSCWNLWIIL